MMNSFSVYRGIFIALVAMAGLAAMPAMADACGAYDLAVNKKGPATVAPGQDVQYTLHVTELNQEKSHVAVEIDIVDTIPAGLVYKPELTKIITPAGKRFPGLNDGKFYNSSSGPRPTYLPQCSLTNGKIACRLPFLGNDAENTEFRVDSVDIVLTFTVPQTMQCGTTLKNVVVASARTGGNELDTDLSNNTSSHEVTLTCPTPTPTPEKDPGLNVQKTDNRDVTRPGHNLQYEIMVENTGEVDLHDVRITDTVPAHLTITSISNGGSQAGNVITWNSISLEEGQKKTVTFSATVKQTTATNTVLRNRVTAQSDDHDLHDEATDDTLVLIQQVAGAVDVQPTPSPAAVPVTAKTGATGLMTLLATVLGGAALTATIRKI